MNTDLETELNSETPDEFLLSKQQLLVGKTLEVQELQY